MIKMVSVFCKNNEPIQYRPIRKIVVVPLFWPRLPQIVQNSSAESSLVLIVSSFRLLYKRKENNIVSNRDKSLFVSDFILNFLEMFSFFGYNFKFGIRKC